MQAFVFLHDYAMSLPSGAFDAFTALSTIGRRTHGGSNQGSRGERALVDAAAPTSEATSNLLRSLATLESPLLLQKSLRANRKLAEKARQTNAAIAKRDEAIVARDSVASVASRGNARPERLQDPMSYEYLNPIGTQAHFPDPCHHHYSHNKK